MANKIIGSTHTFYQNPFFDDVFGSFGKVVPSKRIRYKQDHNKVITDIISPRGTHEFEDYIKKSFSKDTHPNWPYKGRLLIAITIGIKKSDYQVKDVDNAAKSILDALKGLAFVDDVQVDTLHVLKMPADDYGFMIGIKKLTDKESGWYFPLMYDIKPFIDKQ